MSAATFRDPGYGLMVLELSYDDLTRSERAAFGLSNIEPVEGLQQHNSDIAQTTWTPRVVKPSASDLPIYPIPGEPKVQLEKAA